MSDSPISTLTTPTASRTFRPAADSQDRSYQIGIQIRPFDAPLGAEVLGLDLSQPLDPADFARIHQAHLDHHVLVFRDQRITPDQHIAFSRRFGPLQIHGHCQLAEHGTARGRERVLVRNQ